MSKPYTLTTPCGNCPFRKDIPFCLDRERAREIADSIEGGANFYCHKTLDYGAEDDEDQLTSKSRVCAGALATMEREGNPNQITQIAQRLGLYDPSTLDPNAPVFESFAAWVESMTD